jgi:hypothetical protein
LRDFTTATKVWSNEARNLFSASSSQKFILEPSKRQHITTPDNPDLQSITLFQQSAPKSFYKALFVGTPLGEALKNLKMSKAFPD